MEDNKQKETSEQPEQDTTDAKQTEKTNRQEEQITSTDKPVEESNQQPEQPKSSSPDDKKKKRKHLAIGLGIGLGVVVLAGAITGIVLGAKSCSNNQTTTDKSAIDIRTNPGNTIYTDQVVTASKSIVLGSFRLIDKDGNVITEDKSSEITIAFTTPNNTGFTDGNLEFVFNTNDNTYQVSIISGKAASTPDSGSVAITWKNGDKAITSPSQLDVHIIDVTKKTLIQKVLGPDCKTPYTSDQVVPVVVGSGIYLELTDPDTKNRIDANWMVLGGGSNVSLLNTDTETPINALMVNVAPDAETTITIKAFPTDSVLYNDAVFTIKIQKSTDKPIITVQEQSSHYFLQYESIQAVANDTINFTLNNETATNWKVTAASGGDRSNPAKTSDVSFDGETVDGVLTINKACIVGATYTIQATYGDNLTTEFELLLIAGGAINATIKESEGDPTPILKNKQLSNDLAVGDVLTFTLTDYDGPIEYWTATYDARTTYSIPGFSSPTTGNKKTVVWTVTQNDMDSIPAGSHIYFKAFNSNSSNPVATFVFQSKVHVLTSLSYNSAVGPITYDSTNSKYWGCEIALDKDKFQAKLDMGADLIPVAGEIIPSISNDYYVENTDNQTKMIINRGGRSNVIAPIEYSYKTENGVKVVGYNSVNCYGVYDLYSFADKEATTSADINISVNSYADTSSQNFVLYKNGEVCTDENINWTKGSISTSDLSNGAN